MTKPYSFVIQKHYAKRLHYDFRLSNGRVLKSWAIPKNVPLKSGIKRLAIEVDDHSLSYGRFEGEIPQGSYGAGKVIIYDQGYYHHLTEDKEGRSYSLNKAIKNGRIEIELFGQKFKGKYALIRMKGEQWLIFKMKS